MNKRRPAFLLLATGGLAIAGLLAAGTASAATPKTSEAQARYKQEHAKCMRGESNQDRATCLKEAAAALQESKNRAPAAGDGELARNRLKRCETLPAPDREDCAARMDQGKTSGSAQQGGIVRELSTPAR